MILSIVYIRSILQAVRNTRPPPIIIIRHRVDSGLEACQPLFWLHTLLEHGWPLCSSVPSGLSWPEPACKSYYLQVWYKTLFRERAWSLASRLQGCSPEWGCGRCYFFSFFLREDLDQRWPRFHHQNKGQASRVGRQPALQPVKPCGREHWSDVCGKPLMVPEASVSRARIPNSRSRRSLPLAPFADGSRSKVAF